MNEAVQYPVLVVEAGQDVLDQHRILSFIKKKRPVSNKVGNLKKSTFFRRREVRNVAQIIEDAPFGSEVTETAHPRLSSLLVATLRKH